MIISQKLTLPLFSRTQETNSYLSSLEERQKQIVKHTQNYYKFAKLCRAWLRAVCRRLVGCVRRWLRGLRGSRRGSLIVVSLVLLLSSLGFFVRPVLHSSRNVLVRSLIPFVSNLVGFTDVSCQISQLGLQKIRIII